jgi:hypothetical protein
MGSEWRIVGSGRGLAFFRSISNTSVDRIRRQIATQSALGEIHVYSDERSDLAEHDDRIFSAAAVV